MPEYAKEYGVLSFIYVIKALYKISAPTIDRILKPLRVKHRLRGRCTTKPGFIEADMIAHCGDSLSGDFVYTVNSVDIVTGWNEQRAVWGKGKIGVLGALKDIKSRMPFPIVGFDSDNGSEFLNHHLLRHFADRAKPVQFTRSRPYHSDDNAHVEQKNWTRARQWLG